MTMARKDTSDDYFIKDVGAPMAYSADMTASLAMLNNMPFDAYAPNQDVNLYLGQDLLDAGFVPVDTMDASKVYGLFGNDSNNDTVIDDYTLHSYEEVTEHM